LIIFICLFWCRISFSCCEFRYTVKTVLRGHLFRLLEKEKSDLIRQVTSEKRFNSYEIFYDTVIDFSSGAVAHGQWKLIRTSDLPKFFNRIYINILILKFSGQYIRKSNFEDWIDSTRKCDLLIQVTAW
jgi:hypothetical protein